MKDPKVTDGRGVSDGNTVDGEEPRVVSSWLAFLMQTKFRFFKKSSHIALPLTSGGVAGVLLVAATAGFSQLPSATQTAIQQIDAAKVREKNQVPQTRSKVEGDKVPELYAGESQDLGSQMLLSEKPVVRYFEASADTQLTYTSNAFQDQFDPKQTGVWATTLSLAFAPQPWDVGNGKLSFRSGYRHLFWVYDLKDRKLPSDPRYLNGGNFELSSFFISSRYSFNEHWTASAGVDHNRVMLGRSTWNLGRLIQTGNWKEAYTEFNPNWSLDRAFNLTKTLSGSLSYSGGYHFTETDPLPSRRTNDRLDSNLMLSLMYTPIEKWLIQPYVRLGHSAYTRSEMSATSPHRRDLTRSLGVNVTWSASERVSVRLSVSGEARKSNEPLVNDYSKFDVTSGVSFVIQF
ncbi:MAG: hypothetical protein WCO60_17535 [Verrucomicrobiota bacterium]